MLILLFLSFLIAYLKFKLVTGFHLRKQFINIRKNFCLQRKNSKFEYSLQGGEGKFAINPYSGRLQVSGELDYEKRKNYTFRVSVFNRKFSVY